MSFRRTVRRNMEKAGLLRREVFVCRSWNKIEDFFDKYPNASMNFMGTGNKFLVRMVAWVKA